MSQVTSYKNSIERIFFTVLIVLLLIPVQVFAISVSFFMGNATLVRNGKKHSVQMGTKVFPGDILKTGKKSFIEIVYKDGSKIKIQEKSIARIGTKKIKGSDNVALLSGNVTAKFKKLLKKRSVYSPTIICAVRGTEFTVSVSKGGESRVELLKGKLRLKNPYGETNLAQNQKAESSLTEKPVKGSSGTLEQWNASKESDLKNNPRKKGDEYDRYIQKMKKRSDQSDKKVRDYESTIKDKKTKKQLKEALKLLNNESSDTEDDLIQNEASNFSLNQLANRYKDSEAALYRRFLQLKKKSNRVAEQQLKNYQALQHIRDMYKKAYKEIMKKFHDKKNDILKRSRFEP